MEINNSPPTICEINQALKRLKDRKASNDIPPELLRYATDCEELIKEMQIFLGKVWTEKQVPTSWACSRLEALWKNKGSRLEASNYRGLSIGSVLCKICINIILDRLKIWYSAQLCHQQHGFRPGEGTADAIYISKRIHQIYNRKESQLFLLLVDLSAAFDHIVRDWMIRLRFGSDRDITNIEILENLYKHTTNVLTQDPDHPFVTKSGVRQGGPESPPLFNLYIDWVMRLFIYECEQNNQINCIIHKYRISNTCSNN